MLHLVGLNEAAFTHFEFSLVMEKAIIEIENSGFSIRLRTVQDDSVFVGYRKLSTGEIFSGELSRAIAYAVDNIYNHIFERRSLACDGREACVSLDLAARIVMANESEGKQQIV